MPRVDTLGDACSEIVDCAHKTAPIDQDGEYFAVGTPAMRGNTIDYSQARRISKDTFDRWTTRLRPECGDLLLAREAPVGPVVRVPEAENVAPGQRTVLLRPRPGVVESRFLYYYLTSPSTQSALQVKASGSTVPHLNVADVRLLPTPGFPDYSEQQPIAEVLGALDDKIAANDRLAGIVLELARTSYTQAIEGRTTAVMASVLEPVLGGTPSRSDASSWDGTIPWVSAKDITGATQGIVISTAEKISQSAASVKRLRPLPVGSVVLTARGTVGAVARLGIASAINQSCYGFVPGSIPAGCLMYLIENASDQARAMAHGSVFDTITMRTFEHVRVPKLNMSEWARIESVVQPLIASAQQAVSESSVLARTRDELLPLLMSGKVGVREAEKVAEGVV
ncbi:restriction endonuclease subunit S [Kribbella pittospori]|uniref:Restriction endonuclease subunit S n=1 Tax=Kribbella pittospori TaxID=722689 RepID=A0A4R0JWA6_9ACTN|nr:restriction endonuclease subunit S [Kribbella pittospori]TCC50484.1 restriction endonuclease subunit S [Kribbella pittospori]